MNKLLISRTTTENQRCPSNALDIERITPELKVLIQGLNQDLAGEYQAVIMYSTFAATLTGPFRRELRTMFQAETLDELGHAQFLADKIASLGGSPATTPRSVPVAINAVNMLQLALTAEKLAIEDYTKRIHQADAAGEIGLRIALESNISDETRHKDELERILAGWDPTDFESIQHLD